jgi:hypothetical protein
MRSGPGTGFSWIVVSAAAASLLLVAPAVAESEIAGKWTGVVEQSDGRTYMAVMEFDAAGRGRSDYPSLNCSGKLSGTGMKGAYEFRETIASSSGRADEAGRCIDGTIRFTVSGDSMSWSWSGEWRGKKITAAGTLMREPH